MRKQPLDFRREEVYYVTQRWLAAESCALVGVGSVGKSNLLQHLSDVDVHQKYLNKEPAGFKSINIDPNMLGPIDENDIQQACWAGYELLMHRLYMSFYPFDELDETEAKQFYNIYQALQDGKNPLYAYMGIRYLELGLQFFLRKGIQIVFMFDEFEEMLDQMPVKFFHTLRGLRDNNKQSLSYLTFTRAPLTTLIERKGLDMLKYEPFIELFTDNVYYVGPYNEKDALAMVQRLIKRNPTTDYPDYVIEFLLKASGRYAGILRASFPCAYTLGEIYPTDIENEELLNKLARRKAVRTECHTIWTSLTTTEQIILKAVAHLSPYDASNETEDAISALVQKRLLKVDQEKQKLNIEPPVFRVFVATNPDVV